MARVKKTEQAMPEDELDAAAPAPPGVRVTVMGTQNIKGTGLDFVYRWLALAAALGGAVVMWAVPWGWGLGGTLSPRGATPRLLPLSF